MPVSQVQRNQMSAQPCESVSLAQVREDIVKVASAVHKAAPRVSNSLAASMIITGGEIFVEDLQAVNMSGDVIPPLQPPDSNLVLLRLKFVGKACDHAVLTIEKYFPNSDHLRTESSSAVQKN